MPMLPADCRRCSLVPHTLTSVANPPGIHVCELESTQFNSSQLNSNEINSICRRCSLVPHTLTTTRLIHMWTILNVVLVKPFPQSLQLNFTFAVGSSSSDHPALPDTYNIYVSPSELFLREAVSTIITINIHISIETTWPQLLLVVVGSSSSDWCLIRTYSIWTREHLSMSIFTIFDLLHAYILRIAIEYKLQWPEAFQNQMTTNSWMNMDQDSLLILNKGTLFYRSLRDFH